MKLVMVPVSDEHGTPRYETVMSSKVKTNEAGLVSAIVKVWPVRVAVLITGVAAALNW